MSPPERVEWREKRKELGKIKILFAHQFNKEKIKEIFLIQPQILISFIRVNYTNGMYLANEVRV